MIRRGAVQVGTLFNTRIAEAMAIKMQQAERVEDSGIETGPEAMARAARAQSRIFAALPTEQRSQILLRIADALEVHIDDILSANEKDLTAATGRVDNHMLQRLVLKPSKVKQLAEGIRHLANMEEPIGRLLSKTELAQVLCSSGSLLHRSFATH
jgi:gamma-glutamyl phosphate reductase